MAISFSNACVQVRLLAALSGCLAFLWRLCLRNHEPYGIAVAAIPAQGVSYLSTCLARRASADALARHKRRQVSDDGHLRVAPIRSNRNPRISWLVTRSSKDICLLRPSHRHHRRTENLAER